MDYTSIDEQLPTNAYLVEATHEQLIDLTKYAVQWAYWFDEIKNDLKHAPHIIDTMHTETKMLLLAYRLEKLIMTLTFYVKGCRHNHESSVILPNSVETIEYIPIFIPTMVVNIEPPRQCECAICLDSETSTIPVAVLSCQHEFHEPCWNQWKTSCPLCRTTS